MSGDLLFTNTQLLAVWNQKFSFLSWVVVSVPGSLRKAKTLIPWCARCLPYSSRPVLGLGWAPQPFYSSTETWNISRLRVWLFKQNQCWRGKRNAVSSPKAIQNSSHIQCTKWISVSLQRRHRMYFMTQLISQVFPANVCFSCTVRGATSVTLSLPPALLGSPAHQGHFLRQCQTQCLPTTSHVVAFYLQGFNLELAADSGTATCLEVSQAAEGRAFHPHWHWVWEKKPLGPSGVCQTALFLLCHNRKGFSKQD